jgi:hypothetical protein
MPYSLIYAIVYAIVFAEAGALIATIAAFVVSFAFRAAFSKKSSGGDIGAPSFVQQVGESLTTVRQAISNWQYIYGRTRVGGVLTFAHESAADNNLHMIITFAGHVSQEIESIYFNEDLLEFDQNGNVIGKYATTARVRKSLGDESGQPFSELVAESEGKWTDAHRQTGRTKIYVRLAPSRAIFPQGLPNITAVIKGKKVYDPRLGHSVWSNNASLCQADFVCDLRGGIEADYADEINESALIASANIDDEVVDGQKRYTCDGGFLIDSNPGDKLSRLLTANGGACRYIGGEFFVETAAYRIPTVTLTEDDCRGIPSITPTLSAADSCNTVKGIYVSEANLWQATDFPPVSKAAYVAEDNGEVQFHELELPFTKYASTAQRIAKVELERTRRQITVEWKGKFNNYRVRAGNVVMVSFPMLGWVSKPFEVVTSTLLFETGKNGVPIMGVDLSLRETDSNVYNMTTGEIVVVPDAPKTSLPNPFAVTPPTNLVLTDSPKVLDDGTVMPRIIASWTPSGYPFTSGWEVRYRIQGATVWQTQIVTDPTITLQPVSVGDQYEIEVYTLTDISRSAAALTASGHVATGQTSAPPAATVLTATAGLFSVNLTWTINGGSRNDLEFVEILASNTNQRANATRIAVVPWPDNVYHHIGLTPGQQWYYWVRLRDTSRNYGAYYPASATAGVSGVPSTDTSAMLTQLTGAIGTSQLTTDLAGTISLVEGSGGNSVNARIAAEASARASAVSAEATNRINAVQAEADARAAAVITEANARGAAVTSEANTRSAADSSLASQITTVTAAYTAADTGLSNSIATVSAAVSTEAQARADADTSEAGLRTTLAAQMRGTYTGTSVASVTEGLLYSERVARATSDDALSQQITLMSAGAGEQFDYGQIWYFDSGVEGFTSNSGTPTASAGWIRPPNGANPYIQSPSFAALSSSKYTQIKFRMRKVGNPTFFGYIGWLDANASMTISAPTYDANGIAVVTVNMAWTGNITVLLLQMYSGIDNSNYIEYDWIAIGRPSPGASSAQLAAELIARADGDAAEAASRQAISTKLVGMADPASATLANITSGLIYDERSARSTADGALSTSISNLSATVSSNATTAAGLVTSEATARANADGALGTRVDTVQARISARANLVPDVDHNWVSHATLALNYRYDRDFGKVFDRNATDDAFELSQGGHAYCSDYIPVSFGKTYSFAIDAAISATGVTIHTEIAFYNSSFAYLGSGSSIVTGNYNAPTPFGDPAVRLALSASAVAPATAAYCLPITYFYGTNVTYVGVRQPKLEAGALPASIYSTENSLYITQASLATEVTTRANADTAIANSVTALTSTVNGNTSAIASEASTRAFQDSVNAGSISTVSARLDSGDYAAVKTSAAASVSRLGNLEARYGVKVDVNGRVTGYELLQDGTTGTFIILADKFLIVKPDGSGTPTPVLALGTVNGSTALGLNGNLIIDGTIVGRSISAGTITADKIAAGTITADKLAAGTITAASGVIGALAVTEANIQDLQVTRLKIANNAISYSADVKGSPPGYGAPFGLTLTLHGTSQYPSTLMILATVKINNAVWGGSPLPVAVQGNVTLEVNGVTVETKLFSYSTHPVAASSGWEIEFAAMALLPNTLSGSIAIQWTMQSTQLIYYQIASGRLSVMEIMR